ncbi:hypothetical protein [Methanobrevibacter sp.]|uniref:hypothetical protein n=1 Tax=Methanobrevibacter sp. TaxID=66852 RepID=UPI00388E1209
MCKFNRKIYHNKDIKYKLSLIFHVQYIFDLCGIDEKVINILPTEHIDKRFANKRLDFVVECESGNIYNIECESSSITYNTLDKTWNYAKNLICKYDNDIYTLIIALAENNKFSEKHIGTTIHKPIILEMKKLDGNEHLNNIKKKLNNNKELTSHDCAIIETIPDMKNTQKPDIVIEELCNIIKNGKITAENRSKLQATMWLNIDYYIKNQTKRKELMEMIDVKKSCESEFFKWREANINEGRIQGRIEGKIEGKIEIIKELLKSMTPKEIAEKTNTPLTEINKIAKQ